MSKRINSEGIINLKLLMFNVIKVILLLIHLKILSQYFMVMHRLEAILFRADMWYSQTLEAESEQLHLTLSHIPMLNS